MNIVLEIQGFQTELQDIMNKYAARIPMSAIRMALTIATQQATEAELKQVEEEKNGDTEPKG